MMLRGVTLGTKNRFTILLARSQYCSPGLIFSSVWTEVANRSFLIHSTYTTDTKSREENKKTIENLYSLSVDVKKIRRLKEWVLLRDVAYVKEVADILQEMGADEPAVASILERCPEAILHTPAEENLEFLRTNDFSDHEVLQLLSKLKGFIFQLTPTTMQESMLFSKKVFKCNDQELKRLVLKCPALLYYPVPVLEERLEGLLKEGISIAQIRETPMVLELTTQIVQYRVKKLSALGYDIKSGTLESLNGTKKDFEVNYGKIQSKKERPIFNPVAPLNIED
ncbi:Mterf2 [Columba livia]|nr:Mterf2 [Columba livia]